MALVFARSGRTTCVLLSTVLVLAGATDSRLGAAGAQPPATARVVIPFDADWRFNLTDAGSVAMPTFDDSAWRTVMLPHDWSAEGPFSAAWGSGNGYAPGGIGWYRKHFTLASNLAGKLATIELDGVYDHAEVWANGHFVCGRPYGYSSFECPLSPHLHYGTADNVVAVRVDHSRFADSRWYTGSGIDRHHFQGAGHRSHRVHDAVDYQRDCLYIAVPRQRQRPLGLQIPDVGRVDLVERRVVPPAQVTPIGHVILRLLLGVA